MPSERDPAQGIGVFCPGGARSPREMMVSFTDAHRGRYGVGPLCAQVPTAPSTACSTVNARSSRVHPSARVAARSAPDAGGAAAGRWTGSTSRGSKGAADRAAGRGRSPRRLHMQPRQDGMQGFLPTRSCGVATPNSRSSPESPLSAGQAGAFPMAGCVGYDNPRREDPGMGQPV